jgi:hypothetical protein
VLPDHVPSEVISVWPGAGSPEITGSVAFVGGSLKEAKPLQAHEPIR